MEFSYLCLKVKTLCFVIFMIKLVMADLNNTVMPCVSEVKCAAECLNRNCTSFGFNKIVNVCYINFGDHSAVDNETVLLHKCYSKLEELNNATEADVVLRRTALFEKDMCESSAEKPDYSFDCLDINETVTPDNVYTIYPKPSYPCDVQCVIIENKTWTIIQKREDGSQDFYLGWTAYKHGFGNRHLEYWIGNEALHLLTSKASYQLLIQLEDFEGETRYAFYDTFSVDDEFSKYKITVSGYRGNAGDGMKYQNGQAFTTKDSDNDEYFTQNCAKFNRGAWWYNACHTSNLNGEYLHGEHNSYGDGIIWQKWRGNYYSLKVCKMLIRRK